MPVEGTLDALVRRVRGLRGRWPQPARMGIGTKAGTGLCHRPVGSRRYRGEDQAGDGSTRPRRSRSVDTVQASWVRNHGPLSMAAALIVACRPSASTADVRATGQGSMPLRSWGDHARPPGAPQPPGRASECLVLSRNVGEGVDALDHNDSYTIAMSYPASPMSRAASRGWRIWASHFHP
jgi:hypothetical protein